MDQQVIHRLDLLKNNLPENTAQSAKQNIVIKNGNEGKYENMEPPKTTYVTFCRLALF